MYVLLKHFKAILQSKKDYSFQINKIRFIVFFFITFTLILLIFILVNQLSSFLYNFPYFIMMISISVSVAFLFSYYFEEALFKQEYNLKHLLFVALFDKIILTILIFVFLLLVQYTFLFDWLNFPQLQNILIASVVLLVILYWWICVQLELQLRSLNKIIITILVGVYFFKISLLALPIYDINTCLIVTMYLVLGFVAVRWCFIDERLKKANVFFNIFRLFQILLLFFAVKQYYSIDVLIGSTNNNFNEIELENGDKLVQRFLIHDDKMFISSSFSVQVYDLTGKQLKRFEILGIVDLLIYNDSVIVIYKDEDYILQAKEIDNTLSISPFELYEDLIPLSLDFRYPSSYNEMNQDYLSNQTLILNSGGYATEYSQYFMRTSISLLYSNNKVLTFRQDDPNDSSTRELFIIDFDDYSKNNFANVITLDLLDNQIDNKVNDYIYNLSMFATPNDFYYQNETYYISYRVGNELDKIVLGYNEDGKIINYFFVNDSFTIRDDKIYIVTRNENINTQKVYVTTKEDFQPVFKKLPIEDMNYIQYRTENILENKYIEHINVSEHYVLYVLTAATLLLPFYSRRKN